MAKAVKKSNNVWARLYPKTGLHRFIPKSASETEARNHNFADLCRFHGFEPWPLDSESGQWRELCLAILDHTLPGFKQKGGGGRPQKGEEHDYGMAKLVEAITDFESNNSVQISQKTAIQMASIAENQSKDGCVRAALTRHGKRMKLDPDKYAEDDMPSFADRQKRSRHTTP